MPGKVLSILALSLMLECAFAGTCCQVAKSYSDICPTAPYKLPGNCPDNVLALQSQPGDCSAGSSTGSSLIGASLPADSLDDPALTGAVPRQLALLESPPSLAHRGLTHETVLAALKASHFAALDQGADVTFVGDTLRLAVWRHRAAQARDLKIDTILITQAIDQHFPGVFEEVSCSFFDTQAPNQSQRGTLKLSRLLAFGQGKIGQQQLLDAVELAGECDSSIGERYQGLSYRDILEGSPVVQGAYSVERQELSDQLTTLKTNGYDVSQTTRQFLALEDLVRTRQYAELSAAFARTRLSIAQAVAKAQGISVASSRRQNWQR